MLKKFNQFLNEAIGISIIFLLLGIIIIVYPNISIHLIAYFIASLFLLNGVYLITLEIFNRTIFFPIDTLINGIISTLLGFILILYPNIFQVIIPIILGIYFIFGSIFKLRLALLLKEINYSSWIISLISTVLSILCGLLLIIYPETSSIALIMITGITFIIYAIADIIDLTILKKNVNALIKEFKKNIKVIDEEK